MCWLGVHSKEASLRSVGTSEAPGGGKAGTGSGEEVVLSWDGRVDQTHDNHYIQTNKRRLCCEREGL